MADVRIRTTKQEMEDIERSGLPSHQAWVVYDTYSVECGYITGSGSETAYVLMGNRELPFELANVRDGDIESALQFARRWGLLGTTTPVVQMALVEGPEALSVLWGHGSTIRTLLDLYKALNSDDQTDVNDVLHRTLTDHGLVEKEFMEPDWRYPPDLPAARFDSLFRRTRHRHHWRYLVGQEPRSLAFLSASKNPVGTAHAMIRMAINENMATARPSLDAASHGPPPAWLESGFRLGIRFGTLLAAVYYHLATFVGRRGHVGRCEDSDCGRLFMRTDPRQRFCPPTDYKGIGRRQSKCGWRHRKRVQRARRREA